MVVVLLLVVAVVVVLAVEELADFLLEPQPAAAAAATATQTIAPVARLIPWCKAPLTRTLPRKPGVLWRGSIVQIAATDFVISLCVGWLWTV